MNATSNSGIPLVDWRLPKALLQVLGGMIGSPIPNLEDCNDFEKVTNFLKMLMPNSPELDYFLARCDMWRGNWGEAAHILEKIQATDDTLQTIQIMKAECAYQMHDPICQNLIWQVIETDRTTTQAKMAKSLQILFDLREAKAAIARTGRYVEPESFKTYIEEETAKQWIS